MVNPSRRELGDPLYTERTQCQDCYKCVRECPVKSIQVKENVARVVDDLCVVCGHCVSVCPARAKKVRNDVNRVKKLLAEESKVVVSLAPSFVSAFAGVTPAGMIEGLKRLGFFAVMETALGAEAVSRECAQIIGKDPSKIWVSSACPAVVDLVWKYYPKAVERILPVVSPMVASARMIRHELGKQTRVVFIGPCVAKKREADHGQGEVDATLTFEELKVWFAENAIDLRSRPSNSENDFLLSRAAEGVLYPVDGGMIESLRAFSASGSLPFKRAVSISGMPEVRSTLSWIEQFSGGGIPGDEHGGFFELLACSGGCINGPCMGLERGPAIQRRYEVVAYRGGLEKSQSSSDVLGVDVHILQKHNSMPVKASSFSAEQIDDALRRAGKNHPSDELNCGGCGYDSCRNFALAMLEGKAEVAMCLSYMRKLASKKANALINAMPSGVVIADQNLCIVEANAKFAEILGGDLSIIVEAHPGLEGIQLRKAISFHDSFSQVLHGDVESVDRLLHHGSQVLQVLVFPIEKGRLVGCIIQDITEPAMQREQIVRKSREVIYKNLKTVQKIAYLLGENAAESEVILSSIIDSFSVPK